MKHILVPFVCGELALKLPFGSTGNQTNDGFSLIKVRRVRALKKRSREEKNGDEKKKKLTTSTVGNTRSPDLTDAKPNASNCQHSLTQSGERHFELYAAAALMEMAIR